MATISIDFSTVHQPIVGAWKPTGALTQRVPCDNLRFDAEGRERRCSSVVWIDAAWQAAWDRLWPVRRDPVFCPACA